MKKLSFFIITVLFLIVSGSYAQPYHKIISLYAAHTENIYYIGAINQVIGVSKRESSTIKKLKKPVFSFRDSAEKFIAADPDIVLFRPFIYRTHKGLVKKLIENHIKVVAIQPRTIDEMYQYWLKLGKLTGKEKQAKKMVNNFKEKVHTIKIAVSKVKPVKVFLESIHSKFYTFSKSSIANFVLTTAGGINIATNAHAIRRSNIAAFSKEKIMDKASEIEYYISQYGAMNHITKDKIINEPGFQAIKAIKKGHIIIVKENILSRPTPDLIKGIVQLLKVLHPEIYQNLRRNNEL